MNKLLTAGLVLSTVVFSAPKSEAASINRVLIDDFDTEFQDVEIQVPVEGEFVFPITKNSTSNFSSNIIGGYRNINVAMTNATVKGSQVSANVAPEISVENGLFSLSNADGVESDTILTWDGNSRISEEEMLLENNNLALMPMDTESFPIDLISSDIYTNAFSLDIFSIDLDAAIEFTVTNNSNETATLTQSNLPVGKILFEYDDFDVSDGSYMDIFSDVKSIAVEITGPAAFDTSFDSLSAINTSIPEPTSVLSLLGVIGAGASIRRKRMSKK